MKKCIIMMLVAISVSCTPDDEPNLVVKKATISFDVNTVTVEVANIGEGNAGSHLTYIEINRVGVADSAKPQSQKSAEVAGIAAGDSWRLGPIPFSDFSSPRGLNLDSLTSANLVVRADAKDMVNESNESDNVYDRNH